MAEASVIEHSQVKQGRQSMTIRDELLALKDENDLFVPEQIVEWARDNPASALHKSLTWDNDKAASEYRIWQVRRLISINVVYADGHRQLVSLSIDRTNSGGGYRDVQDILPRPDLREIMLADALRELERMQEKYEHVSELIGVWAETEKVRRSRRARKPEKEVRAVAGPA